MAVVGVGEVELVVDARLVEVLSATSLWLPHAGSTDARSMVVSATRRIRCPMAASLSARSIAASVRRLRCLVGVSPGRHARSR
jgi:hypothetical protein